LPDNKEHEMRNVGKLLLVALMAVAAFAFSASSASASLPVEVMDEASGGDHCADLGYANHRASGGCHLLVHSDSVLLIQHRAAGDVIVNNCVNDYEIRLDENGEGWIQDVSFTPGDPGCGTAVTPCTEEGAKGDFPWHIDIEHDGAGGEVGEAEICIDEVIAPGISCELEGDIDISLNEDAHELSAEADDATFTVEENTAHPVGAQTNCNNLLLLGALEVDAHWTITGETGNVEIEHLGA
jgi:hypothetical protein